MPDIPQYETRKASRFLLHGVIELVPETFHALVWEDLAITLTTGREPEASVGLLDMQSLSNRINHELEDSLLDLLR